MGKIVKLIRLPLGQQKLLFQAVAVVGLIRIGLWVLPFRTMTRVLSRLAGKDISNPIGGEFAPSHDPDNQIAWRVKTVSRWIPYATCLTQAFATHLLLRRRGRVSDLRIGVAKGEGGKLEAHAWVEMNGRVVIGKLPDLRRFVKITQPTKGIL